MKILLISNLYPPHYIGGFELIAQDIAIALSQRNHQVTILTSTFGVNSPIIEQNILRLLPDPFEKQYQISKLLWREVSTRILIKKVFKRTLPDVILIMGATGIPTSLFRWLHKSGFVVIYSIFDEYLLECTKQDRWYRYWNDFSHKLYKYILKRLIRTAVVWMDLWGNLDFSTSSFWFGSHHLAARFELRGWQGTNRIVQYPPIVPGALNLEPLDHNSGQPLRLVFASRLCKEKGLHTVIKAIGILKAEGVKELPTLTVAAQLLGDAYEHQIKELINDLRINNQVEFLGLVPKEHMAKLYNDHHVVIFATENEEPFGMVPIEAMTAGVAVISTATGGAKEYLQAGSNALIFEQGDPIQLAKHIAFLTNNEDFRQSLIHTGRHTAASFTQLTNIIDRVENFIYQVAVNNHQFQF
jgi:glycosyltransferase involved in cell wall biosynthesis